MYVFFMVIFFYLPEKDYLVQFSTTETFPTYEECFTELNKIFAENVKTGMKISHMNGDCFVKIPD